MPCPLRLRLVGTIFHIVPTPAMTTVPALPVPVVRTHDEYLVVRDDLLPGGTKRRGLMAYVQQHSHCNEFVYASPCEGYAQLGLAHACHDLGRQATAA
eukprot:COSAG01_NODE_16_length_40091_cov_15.728646_23_plen_98_part_00